MDNWSESQRVIPREPSMRSNPGGPTVFREGRPWAGPFTVDEEGRGYWEVAAPIGGQGEPICGALKVIVGQTESSPRSWKAVSAEQVT
jgi:hypothetical protein